MFSPHNDDAALFSAFNALRHEAHVVTVLRSEVQNRRHGISAEQREREDWEAIYDVLGLEWTQWPYLDTDPDWQAVKVAMQALDDRLEPDLVFAPAVEDGGHDHHNRVGQIAQAVYGSRVTSYLTYTVEGKSTDGTLVEPEPGWVTLKLRGLSCYRSQIETPAAGCTEHFLRGQHEYIKP